MCLLEERGWGGVDIPGIQILSLRHQKLTAYQEFILLREVSHPLFPRKSYDFEVGT